MFIILLLEEMQSSCLQDLHDNTANGVVFEGVRYTSDKEVPGFYQSQKYSDEILNELKMDITNAPTEEARIAAEAELLAEQNFREWQQHGNMRRA